MKEVLFYFALFFIYSFIGWLIEMFCVNVILKQKFANRGFLIGPYCPIYGSASLIMIFLLSRYKEDILVLFFGSIINSVGEKKSLILFLVNKKESYQKLMIQCN